MRILLALLLLSAAAPALAATGQDQFNDSCGGCHTVDGTSFTAPSLKGVVGRKIASLPDFQYSDALKAKTGTWTDATLEAFLADPKTFAPGNNMTASVSDPKERQAIIDYLKTVK
jgi:cytochrome c